MEEQKYYTPAPEDLRIGFELEIQDKVISDVWRSHNVKYPHEISFLIGNQLDAGKIRVPYLTAEQIESEGWELSPHMKNDTICGWIHLNENENYDYKIWYHFKEKQLELYDDTGTMDSKVLYNGRCKCVNDLRLICKILGINK